MIILMTNKRFSLEDFKFLEFPVNYFHNSQNIGFGKANNLNFNNYVFDNDDIFIISNPDTFFESKEMQNFINAFQNHSRIVCANPLIKIILFLSNILPKKTQPYYHF